MRRFFAALGAILLMAGCSAKNSGQFEITAKATDEILRDSDEPALKTTLDISAIHRGDKVVFNGYPSPTLYTGLTTAQQNSVVSICLNYYNQCFCTGTLISPHVVLTAAHCVYEEIKDSYGNIIDTEETEADKIEVRIGADDYQAIKKLDVEEVYYRDYIYDGYNEDIAVLILKEGDNTTTKIDIQSGEVEPIVGHEVQSVGYGRSASKCKKDEYGYCMLDEYGETIDDPYYVDNSIRWWTTLDCIGFDSDGQINVYGNGLSGMAPGDSGGPLLYDFGDGVRVAGVLSTSQFNAKDEWLYNSFYTPIDVHEKWVRGFVNRYDDSVCRAACKGVECGPVTASSGKSCSCGGCGRGMECNAANKCEKKKPGSGGVCVVNNELTYKECRNDGDCPAETHCYFKGRGSTCVTTCTPEPCSSIDSNSVCTPFYVGEDSYLNLCTEEQPATCNLEATFCTTADGGQGYCFELYEGEGLRCYKQCRNVDTCDISEGCKPYDICNSVCLGKKCGHPEGCNCGDCGTDKVCNEESYTCVYPEPEPTVCTCDFDTACTADCSCDPECPCTCDVSDKCDCACDADCRNSDKNKKKGCNGGGSASLAVLLSLALFLRRKVDCNLD